MLTAVPDADDEAFCGQAADLLAGLPGVLAVTLGGSRAAGTARPDSDWDFAVYYHGDGFERPACARWAGQGKSSRSAGGAAGCSTGAPGCMRLGAA